MILDYSQCLLYQNIHHSMSPDEEAYFVQHSPNIEDATFITTTRGENLCRFYEKLEWCPKCKSSLYHEVDGDKDYPYFPRQDEMWICQDCGWWSLSHFSSMDDGSGSDIYQELYQFRRGILRYFNESDSTIPLTTLYREVSKKTHLLYDIHPSKFEEFVGSVLSDFYNCKVHLIGKTGDGGIDLIIIEKDNPIAVQVKRRTRPDSIEKIEEIREFLAATILEGYTSAIFVSTAKEFTRGAKDVASRAVSMNLVKKFELINQEKLLSIFSLTVGNTFDWYINNISRFRTPEDYDFQ